jgi:hypothetical protein
MAKVECEEVNKREIVRFQVLTAASMMFKREIACALLFSI